MKTRIDRVKLKTELYKRDLTQVRLAELSGISRTTINMISAGKSCSEETGEKIAAALGVDLKSLLEK